MGGSFWQKDSLITHTLFELCLLSFLAQSTSFWDTLYILPSIYQADAVSARGATVIATFYFAQFYTI
jgi:hypothetical protein